MNTNEQLENSILLEIYKLQTRTEMIERLLTVLISKGSLHDIGGYVYGETSNEDPFIILYPYPQKMVEKVTRVYEHDFGKLPHFIPTKQFPPKSKLVSDNPKKSVARKQGIYHNCKPFTIATYPGKQTNMGPEVRFHSVVRIWGEDIAPVKDPFKVPHKPVEQPSQEPEPEEERPKEEDQKVAALKEQAKEKRPAAVVQEKPAVKKVAPPTWSPKERQQVVAPATRAMLGDKAEDTLFYGNKEPVPDSAGTHKIYWEYVEVKGIAPKDGQELKEFYEESKNEEG